jgi:CPA1 family monovalent cation:H+ antiporter
VAVSALARRLALPARLQALVQAESLFNDGTSLVLFQVAVSIAVGGAAGMTLPGVVAHGAGEFFVLAAGGVLAGSVVAAGAVVVRRRITDPVLETVAALITPYAAYLAGETVHVSAVTAVIVAGLVIGAKRAAITTAQTRLQVHAVFQTVIFVLEAVVFSLIGLQLPALVRAQAHPAQWAWAALAVAATLVVIRVAWVFPLHAVIQRRRGVRRPAWAVPAVVSWAGTRGVVPLAAALSIPLATVHRTPLPQRDLVLVLATAVIAVTLVVQGLTLEPLARAAGIGEPGAGHEEVLARLRLAEAGLARLDELAEARAAPDELIDRLRASLQARIGHTRARTADGPAAQPGPLTERDVRSDLLAAENAELTRLYDEGAIGAATRRQLQHALDLEATRLSDGQR